MKFELPHMSANRERILGGKMRVSDVAWRKVMKFPDKYVDLEQLQHNVKRVKNEINIMLEEGYHIEQAWSAGKDSIVLAHISREFDLDKHFVTSMRTNIMFDDTRQWIEEVYGMHGITLIDNGMSMNDMTKHLFPQSSREGKRWLEPKWKAMLTHQQSIQEVLQQATVTMLGRRKDDANKIMSKYYVNKKGFRAFNPLMDWSNEELAAYIGLHSVELPPSYHKTDGFKIGSKPWPLTSFNYATSRQPNLKEHPLIKLQ